MTPLEVVHLGTPRDSQPLCGATGETTCDHEEVTCAECTRRHDAITAESLDDVAAVLDAFIDETRGDGGELIDGVIHLGTIAEHVVVAWPGSEGWWEARLEVRAPRPRHDRETLATFPLLQGPVWYADSETTMQDVVTWLRAVCDASADRE